MKKISIFILSVLFISTLVFIGCSSEDSVATNTDNSKSSQRIYKADVKDYISDFYNTTFVYSDSIETSDKERDYIIREITVGTDTIARGYLVSDAADNEPIGYIDIDHTSHVMKMIDMATEEMDVVEDLDEDPVFMETKGDLISIVKLANAAIASNKDQFILITIIVEIGDNFWRDVSNCGPAHLVTNTLTFAQSCEKTCTVKKKRFWITWSSTTSNFPATGC